MALTALLAVAEVLRLLTSNLDGYTASYRIGSYVGVVAVVLVLASLIVAAPNRAC